MIQALAWIGRRSQWVLALGVCAALVIPGPGDLLAGTIPIWVTLIYGLAMARVDLLEIARKAVSPKRLLRNLGLCLLLSVAVPSVVWLAATASGLPQTHIDALVYTTAGPPMASSAAFCLMLGFNAAFALEITVLGTMIAPIVLPVMSRLLLGDAVPLDMLEMTGRLAILIGIGSVGAILARWSLGAARINRHALTLDGLASVILVAFLFPLFDGLTDMIALAPALAIGAFALACLSNLGTQIALLPFCRRVLGEQIGGATALMTGNWNAALALASLPPDPFFTLYVAMYQFPIYFTPLVLRRLTGKRNLP